MCNTSERRKKMKPYKTAKQVMHTIVIKLRLHAQRIVYNYIKRTSHTIN
jgi:hypothetical protein